MGIPKKEKEVKSISLEQAFDVLEFTKQMSVLYPNMFTPDLVNSRMKDINMNPLASTEKEIEMALSNPKSNEDKLISYAEYFGYTNMMYKRLLAYITNIPAFDMTYVCTNIEDVSDYKNNQYKVDKARMEEFLDKFNHRAEFDKIMKMMVQQETYYGVFRDDGQIYTLQELPRKYCQLTGRSDYGLVFDFNMNWFYQAGVDINSYPEIFKEMYTKAFQNNKNGYNSSASLDNRDGSFIYWVQTSSEDGFWAFKFTPEQAGNVPYLSPLMQDLVLAPTMRKLQTNKNIIESSKIIMGLIPLMKDNKSGNVKDMLGLSEKTLAGMMTMLRKAVNEVFSISAVPFEDVKAIDFDTNENNILLDYNKNTAASSGSHSGLIYNVDKANALETQYSIEVDELLSTRIYPYFEKFLEFYINNLTKKYKFKITLEGTKFTKNRGYRLDTQIKLLDKGIALPQKIASAIGMNPHDFERQRMMAIAEGWINTLTPPVTAYTNSSKDNKSTQDLKGGRKKKSDEDLTESGFITREQGSNDLKKV